MDHNLYSYFKGPGKQHNVTQSKRQVVAKTNANGMHSIPTFLRATEICEGFRMGKNWTLNCLQDLSKQKDKQ